MTNITALSGTITKSTLLPPRTVTCIASTGNVDYCGDVVVPTGITSRSGTVPLLWQHDSGQPIGRAAWRFDGAVIRATLTFAPEGVSEVADRALALVKSGVLTDVSVGFDALAREPIPGGGWRYTKTRLVEISVVSVGANPDAVIISRARTQKAVPESSADRQARVRVLQAAAPCNAPETRAERLERVAALAGTPSAPRLIQSWEEQYRANHDHARAVLALDGARHSSNAERRQVVQRLKRGA
jgi:HK97 family phage prohead protease